MSKRFLITLVTLLVIGLGAAGAAFLVKGYKLSSKTLKVESTGIISVTSIPDGASVFIDGHLVSATNTNISSLKPKNYSIKIIKEGFIPWEKNIEVKSGLVSEVKVTLFPAIPTIYPLTFGGADKPTFSPDGSKLAFVAPLSTPAASLRQKGGVWVYNMLPQPISFNHSSSLRQLLPSSSELNLSKATLRFSPDSKSILVTLGAKGDPLERNFLISADQPTSLADVRDITPTVEATVKAWDEDQKGRYEARVATIKDLAIQKVASETDTLKWSPDETKFLYREKSLVKTTEKPGDDLPGFRVYDLTESKKYDLPISKAYIWLPDSRHVILVQEEKVAIADFDGTNAAVIYAGTFLDALVFPWPDSSRLAILSSIPTPTANQPNLFGINLK